MKKVLAAIILGLGMVSLGGCIVEAYPAYPHYHYYGCYRCHGRGFYYVYDYHCGTYVRIWCHH